MTKTAFVEGKALKAALDFPTVLSHYGIAVAKGQPPQVLVKCPFHDDSDPSCSINYDIKAFRCFPCEAEGNILDFVMLMEHGEKDKRHFPATAKIAMEIMGITSADLKPAPKKPAKAKNKPAETQKKAKAPRHAQNQKTAAQGRKSESEPSSTATEPKEAKALKNKPLDFELTDLVIDHPFFEQRGLSPETVKLFGLGKCNKGIMRGRIVIPIHDDKGELIAYVGRHVEDEPEDKSERYRFPKGFHKSIALYNLHRANQFGSKHLVLVEGYWSVIRLHLAGIPVAACFGASLSEAQVDLIASAGYKTVTVIFDGDESGQRGADAATVLLSKQLYARQIILEDGIKPDTMPDEILSRLK